jgi:hypothetical protein
MVPKDAAISAASPTFAALIQMVQADSFDTTDFGANEPKCRLQRDRKLLHQLGAMNKAEASRFIARRECECTQIVDVLIPCFHSENRAMHRHCS